MSSENHEINLAIGWMYPLNFPYLDKPPEESIFQIPTIRNDEASNVSVDLKTLPDPSTILKILRHSRPPFDIWSSMALHYLVRYQDSVFCLVLEDALINADRNQPDSAIQETFCLDLLANHYASKMSTTRDTETTAILKSKVAILFQQSDKLDSSGLHHRVSMECFLAMTTTRLEEAQFKFEKLLKEAPDHRVIIQALAFISYIREDFVECLKYLQRIYSLSSKCSLLIRLVMADCLVHTGKIELARLAYERSLELNSNCTVALLNLAFYYLSDGSEESVIKGLSMLKHVYRAHPAEPLIHDLIIDNVSDLHCLKMHPMFKDNSLEAVNACCIGIGFHCFGKYDEALHHYQKAVELSNEAWEIPLFAAAQLYCWKGAYVTSVNLLKKLMIRNPSHSHALRLWSLLCLKYDGEPEVGMDCLGNLKESFAFFSDDVNLCIKIAETYENIDKKIALEFYLKAEKMFLKKSILKKAPVELYNNIAVLYHLFGDFVKSENYYQLAESSAREEDDTSARISIMYNQGCLSEEKLDYETARRCYNNILESHPGYLDACIRLGLLNLRCGRSEEAEKVLQKAVAFRPDHPDILVLLGQLQVQKNVFDSAENYFSSALRNPCVNSDTYSLLNVGNGYLDLLSSSSETHSKTKVYAERAFSLFNQVHMMDGTNVYAVNGIGAVLAKTGYQSAAQEVFLLLCKEYPDMKDPYINYGIISLEQKNQNTYSKFFIEDQQRSKDVILDSLVLTYLARSQFYKKDFDSARKTLQVLIRMFPECHIHRFNFGLTLKVSAVETLKSFRSDFKKVSIAVRDLELARNTFESIIEDNHDKPSKEIKRAEHEAKVCSDLLRQSIHLVERSDSCSSLGSSRRISLTQPLTYGQLSIDDDVPVRRRNGSGSLSVSGKREAVAQRGSDQKDKLARRHQEPCAIKKRSRKSAQLEEHYSVADSLLAEKRTIPTPVIEPQRKRARAVAASNELLERRKKRVADRKRRELEIEKIAVTSSDDEILVAIRPNRKKPEKSEENATNKRIVQRESLTSDSDTFYAFRDPGGSTGKRLDSKNVSVFFSEKTTQLEVILAPAIQTTEKRSPLQLSSVDSGTDSEIRETESEENKSSAFDSDESGKRLNSDLERKPRKRKTLVHLN